MPLTGQFYAICCTLCWAMTSVSFTYASRRIGSLPVNLLRLTIAVLIFMVYSFIRTGAAWPQQATAHQWFRMSASGFVGFFMGDLFLFRAFILIGTRLAMLI